MVASIDEAKVLLYGEEQATFVAARDALVKELRQAKDRELASEVKALRKPSVVAAEVNRVVRADPGGVEILLQAAELLRAAQAGQLDDAVLDVGALQEQYRAAVRALAQTAESRKSEVRAALEAATIDIESNDALRSGSLVVVPEAVSIFGVAAAAPPDELALRRAKRQQKQSAATRTGNVAPLGTTKENEAAVQAAKDAKKERARALSQAKKQLTALTKQHRAAQRAHLDALDVETEAMAAIEISATEREAVTSDITEVEQHIADLQESLAALVVELQQAVVRHESATSSHIKATANTTVAEEAVRAHATSVATVEALIKDLSAE